jgi:hypothetical protein
MRSFTLHLGVIAGLALPGDTRRATLLGVALISSW